MREPEIFTVDIVDSTGEVHEYLGAVTVQAQGSFLFIEIEDGSAYFIPDHRIRLVTVTPGRA